MGNVKPVKMNTGTGFEENNGGVPWSLAEMKMTFRASKDVVGKTRLVVISPLLKKRENYGSDWQNVLTFLRVKFQTFLKIMRMNMPFTNFKIAWSALICWLIAWCREDLECLALHKPSPMTSHMVNLPHGWSPHIPTAFLQLWYDSQF